MSALNITRIRRLIPIYIRYLKITEFPFKPLMRRIAGGDDPPVLPPASPSAPSSR